MINEIKRSATGDIMSAHTTTIKNQLGEDVPVTYEQGGILSGKWSNPACEDDPHYCKTTTMHCVDCGATWDREEYTGGDVIRGAKCNC